MLKQCYERELLTMAGPSSGACVPDTKRGEKWFSTSGCETTRHGLRGLSYLVLAGELVALDLARSEQGKRQLGHLGKGKRWGGFYRQASQAVFCFLGGGRVFASSWIWFWTEGVEKLKPVYRGQ